MRLMSDARCQSAQGSSTGTPVGVKSWLLRVTTVIACTITVGDERVSHWAWDGRVQPGAEPGNRDIHRENSAREGWRPLRF